MLVRRWVPPPVRVGPVTLAFDHRTLVMGVLNVTPDSFSDGGSHPTVDAAVDAALRMLDLGADIVDVGGESTRPGAPPVPVAEEMRRVVPVIEALARRRSCAVSVDTRNAAVARAAVEAGAGMINDVSAGTHDSAMFTVAAQTGAALVLMHMRGTPTTMQQGMIAYDDVVAEVSLYLDARARAAEAAGVARQQVLVDPGFGFGKTVQHNLELTTGLDRLCEGGRPVVYGSSRKSTLGHLLGGLPPRDRVVASVASCVMAVERGAHVVRVHDVAETRQALAVVDAARGAYIAPAG